MSEGPSPGPRRTELDDVAEAEVLPSEEVTAPRPRAGRLARSTAFFAFATGLSRIAGLVREIVAASFFGAKGQMSAFTIAFQLPNLVRSLFADAAIQAAFVPVFTEHLERGENREAFRLGSTLIYLVALVLGLLTALFILLAPSADAAVRARIRGRAGSAHGRARAGPVPDPAPARGERDGGRGPEQLRPLRRLRDRALLLEPGDHRGAGRLRAPGPRAGRDPSLRGRGRGRDRRPARDLRRRHPQHAVSPPAGLRLALAGRPPGAVADAPGDDQPRADQRQPARQQLLRQPRLRPRAGGDRQGIPDLHAAPGDLLGRRCHGPLSDPVAIRRAGRVRRPARDDGQRDAPDRPSADARDCRDPRSLGADGAPRLPAGRVRRRPDRACRDGAVLVRLLAAVQRPLPAPDADLLQPAEALGPVRNRGDEPRRHGALLGDLLRALRGRRDRRRDRDRHRRQRRRAERDPASPARPARARPVGVDDGEGDARLGCCWRSPATRPGACSTSCSAAAWRARSRRSASRWRSARPSTAP